MRLRLHPLFEADKGDAGGGSPAPAPAPDPLASFQNLLARSSSAEQLANRLFEENHSHRTRIRELEAKVPAQGAMVLTAEQAAQWQSYQQLGAPDQVQTTIQKAKKLERDLELRDVASAAGYSVDVLRTLAADLAFEVRDEQKDGKPAKAVYVKVDGKDIPAETYAAEQWAAFLPALKPAAVGQPGAPAIGPTNPLGNRGAPPPAPAFDPNNPPSLFNYEWKT
jgi:hypothetical protein